MEILAGRYDLKKLIEIAEMAKGYGLELTTDQEHAVIAARSWLNPENQIAIIYSVDLYILDDWGFEAPDDPGLLQNVLDKIANRMMYQELEWEDAVCDVCKEYGLREIVDDKKQD